MPQPRIQAPFERVQTGAIVLLAAVVFGIVGYHVLGDYSWLESIWLVVITISTVGYGESSQSSPAVQGLTVSLILVGLTAAVYTSTGFFQLVLEGELERTLGFRRMTRHIEQLKGHVIICGFGRSGRSLALDLVKRNRDIVIIENNPEQLEDFNEFKCPVVEGDATEEWALKRAGIDRARALVIALPSDADNVFITLTARELNKDILIVARATVESTAKKLRQAGAQKVVMPAAVSAKLMSRMVLHPSAADWLELIAENSYQDLDIEELIVAECPGLIGQTVQQTEAQRTHRLLVVAVRGEDGKIVANPGADYEFHSADVAVMMGNPANIKLFRNKFRS